MHLFLNCGLRQAAQFLQGFVRQPLHLPQFDLLLRLQVTVLEEMVAVAPETDIALGLGVREVISGAPWLMDLEAGIGIIGSVHVAEEVGSETARERGVGGVEVMLRAEVVKIVAEEVDSVAAREKDLGGGEVMLRAEVVKLVAEEVELETVRKRGLGGGEVMLRAETICSGN